MAGIVRRLLEKRDVQFSPALSVMLAARGSVAASSVNVTSETAMRLVALRACVRVVSEDVASLPLILYRRFDRGKDRATDIPLYRLLHDAPNPEMTSYQFRETMTANALLWGNAFAEIVYGADGWPAQLWPLPPSRVSARRTSRNGELEYYVSPPIGNPIRLTAQYVFHLPALSTGNSGGVWGQSPITDARDAIGLGMAGEQFASGFFTNGARPSVIYEHPGQLSDAAYERLRNDLDQEQVGLTNAQRTAILEEGMKANALSVSPEDAQFIDQRRFSVEEMARLYRVQPHKIGVVGAGAVTSYASVEQANIDHVVSTIRPWVVRWEQQIAAKLIPSERPEFFAEFLLTALLRGDNAARASFYQTMWQIGAMSDNDIREAENMNPYEGGDDYYTPLNFARVGAEPQAASRNGHKEGSYVLVN